MAKKTKKVKDVRLSIRVPGDLASDVTALEKAYKIPFGTVFAAAAREAIENHKAAVAEKCKAISDARSGIV